MIIGRYASLVQKRLVDGLLLVTPGAISNRAQKAIEEFPFLVRWMTLDAVKRQVLQSRNQIEQPEKIINLNHNDLKYIEAMDLLTNLLNKLTSSNNTGLHADIRDRLVVEVKSGISLLGGNYVRIGAIVTVLGSALLYIVQICTDEVLRDMTHNTLKAISGILGNPF